MRAAERARGLLARPEAWLDRMGDAYAVRLGADRRRRPAMSLTGAEVEALRADPGLAARPGGGWVLTAAGRPGIIEGERTVMQPDGRSARRRVNLGESPVAWLARRKDAQGRPWLTLAEAAAGERLREEFEASGGLGRVTMRWEATARSGAARGPTPAPAERVIQAKARVEAALAAAGPGLREILERTCMAGTALEAAERDLGLPRRAGKTLLKLALQRLAAHYRIG